jgi:hypothetical protein
MFMSFIRHSVYFSINTMDSQTQWSVESEELLIELWQENPCLYDISSKEYGFSLQMIMQLILRQYVIDLLLVDWPDMSLTGLQLELVLNMFRTANCHELSYSELQVNAGRRTELN